MMTLALPHLDRLAYRLAQIIAYLRPARTTAVMPPAFAAMLPPDAICAFDALAASDRAHLIAVATELRARGSSDELVIAGLLHDIGKLPSKFQSLALTQRVAKVALTAIAPSLLVRIATRPTPPRGMSGLWAYANHARIGAGIARDAGCDERVCWLIAHHEDTEVTDPELRLLIAIDDSRSVIPGGAR